jgi:hypothetical protein
MRPQFRCYFQNIVDMMLNQKENIKSFIGKDLKKGTEKKAPGKTRRSIAGGKKRKTKRNY